MAHYSVIRYMPDPGRGERLNIGILLWEGERYRVQLDDNAVERVVRENPGLVRESLLYVGSLVRERLREKGSINDAVAEFLVASGAFRWI